MARPIPERTSFDNGLNEMKGICFFFHSLFSVLLARSLFLWVSQRGKVENNDTGCGLFLGASFINFMGSARGVAFFVGVLASHAGKGQVGGKLNLRRIESILSLLRWEWSQNKT